MSALRPLFPVEDVVEANALLAPMSDEPRRGLVWPVAVFFGDFDDQPAIVVELAFCPARDFPEPLALEVWTRFRDRLGLSPFAGASSLRVAPDGRWHVDFGPHTLVSNAERQYQMVLPRRDAEWEDAVRATGSCMVLVGTGLGVVPKDVRH